MIVITGATGNTGKPAAEALLTAGEKIRVIGRSADHLAPFVQKGAEAVVTPLNDAAALTKAFQGADAVYLMLPSNPQSQDVLGDEAKLTDVYVEAVIKSGVKHVVILSSIGADVPEKNGPIAGLRHLEEKINAIAGVNTLALRPANFMENFLMSIAPMRKMGFLPGAQPREVPMPMVACRDIGEYAARRLKARDFSRHAVQELHGERDVTMKEAAGVIGAAIGKPGLTYTQVPLIMLEPALVATGMGKNLAGLLIEMWRSFNDGTLKARETRNAENTTPTSIETFVKDKFLPAYLAAANSASAQD
jgi:uncharacterized protein YbjT (DUF2867 family)